MSTETPENPNWILPIICQQNANKTGVYVAITTAFILYPVTMKLGFNKNKAILTTLATSSVSAYFAARYSMAHCQKINAPLMEKIE